MDFLIHSRAGPSAANLEDDPALDEQHWSYMDRFADGMIARGPTLGVDRATWTGSIHILDLPSAAAVHRFLEGEPYNRTGVYEAHLIRRFENLLGRTMWESPSRSDEPRFFVIAHALTEADEPGPAVPLRELTALPRERLIVHGRLLTGDDAKPVGIALALQAPTRAAVDVLLTDLMPGLREHLDVEILDWEFGGRR